MHGCPAAATATISACIMLMLQHHLLKSPHWSQIPNPRMVSPPLSPQMPQVGAPPHHNSPSSQFLPWMGELMQDCSVAALATLLACVTTSATKWCMLTLITCGSHLGGFARFPTSRWRAHPLAQRFPRQVPHIQSPAGAPSLLTCRAASTHHQQGFKGVLPIPSQLKC